MLSPDSSGRSPSLRRGLREPAPHQADLSAVPAEEPQRAQDQRGPTEAHHLPHQVSLVAEDSPTSSAKVSGFYINERILI